MSYKNSIAALTLMTFLGFASAAHADEIYKCPTADYAKAAFESGEVDEWPNYHPGASARVQKQHPDTAIIAAQAKFIKSEKGAFALCQYYTHIGMLITTGFYVKEKGEGVDGGYWRSEYKESLPEQDVKGKEMLDVCMEKKGNVAIPSVKCEFTLLSE